MRSMGEVGRRSTRLFNEVCLPGEKIEKPAIGAAYFFTNWIWLRISRTNI